LKDKADRYIERFFIIGPIIVVLLIVALVFVAPRLAREPSPESSELAVGEEETLSARVVRVLEEGTADLGGGVEHPYQKLLLHVESGSLEGEDIIVEEGTVNITSQDTLYRVGDRVYVQRVAGISGDLFYVTDTDRTNSLLWMAALFVGLVLAVGRSKGLRSLAGTLFSLVVILGFIVPQILAGRDPVLVSITGSVVLLAVSNYLVYGWNPKAHAALAGMTISLILTGLLAWLFVEWARLTGLGAEETSYLVIELGSGIRLRGLVLGGIIIGSLGVLDDICIGQAAAVFELINANRDLSWVDLFRSSMNIGRDHIAALVNTLFLAYVGASMPLMLVFSIYQESFIRRINREPIAEEIVRTLVGSLGLVLAVPITGLIASLAARWAVSRESAKGSANSGARDVGTSIGHH
jgi:uncharacterized membrane protein